MELEKNELFSSLSQSELSQVRSIARRVHLARGETIFSEGDYEKNIYIVETGQVEIFKRSPLHGEQSLAIMKNGDCFGEMAFFEKTATRSASARTLQASAVIIIEGQDFESLLSTHPSISLKLLSTLSQRLRETNKLASSGNSAKSAFQHDCRLLTVASAKDGYGKSIFATSLARMLCTEVGKKVLFLDLDLYFAGGTQLLGVHSPRSIIDIINKFRANEQKFDMLQEAVRVNNDLWVIPAPRSFLEAEQVHASDVSTLVKEARKHFDYIVADTGAMFDENLFTILDISDMVFFMVNYKNLTTLTDNVRFFQGIAKLSYPRERIILLGNNINKEFPTDKTTKVFPFPVIGALPQMADYEPQFGKTPYDVNPSSPFCEVLRLLARNVLKETNIKRPAAKSSIMSMLFGEKDPEDSINTQLIQLTQHGTSPFSPIVSSSDVRSQVKYVRYNLLFGYIEEAKQNLLTFMDYSQSSAPLCELLGEIYLIENLKAEAIEAFQRAVALDDQQHVALGFLASMVNDPGMLTRSLVSVKEKIAANPAHLDLLNDYGKILVKNEKYDEAIAQFQLALKENPNYLEAKINMALCLAQLGKSDRAIETLLFIENKNPRIYFALGEIFYKTGRHYLAYKAFTKAEALYPSYPGIRPKIYELTSYLRKLDTLIDLHERFVNTNPTFPDLHAKLGNFYHLAGKSELAISEYNKALELNPDYKLAADKLDAIKKDIIWKMGKNHLETNLESQNAVMAKHLKMNIKLIKSPEWNLPDESTIQIRNVRTAKLLQKVLTKPQIDSGTLELDCAPLGTLSNQDILVIQIIDTKNKKLFRFAPHYIEKDEITANRCEILLDLEKAASQIHSPELFAKYFLVHLSSKHLAKTLNNNKEVYKAVMKNLSNNLETSGHINPENDEQINFVLNGSAVQGTEDLIAVKPGDLLSIKIQDLGKEEIFSIEFAVGETDVKNFCKTVVPKD